MKYEHLDAVISRYFVRYPSSLSGQQVSVVHLVCEDGNDKEHARREIPFTDFPMPVDMKNHATLGLGGLAKKKELRFHVTP